VIPEIRHISAEETIAVRWPVLRPGFPRETAEFSGDTEPTTFHLGVFVEGRLVGVASVYDVPCPEVSDPVHPCQLRGMATVPEVRGSGCGRALLAACVENARVRGCDLLWCNARVSAADFYSRAGWQVIGAQFDIPTVGPHFPMRLRLDQLARQPE
jgi:GNAT superfamily N-acetyltransferase